MEVPKLTNDLDWLLCKDTIIDSDVIFFVRTLLRLSDTVKFEESFHTFNLVVMQWIRAYKPIFSHKPIDDSATMCIRRSGKVLTHVFLSLMQSFGKYETDHNLEFYGHWKYIISDINPRKLAEYVSLHGQQFKSLIEKLRTSTNRCDQISILTVLLLYIKLLPSDKLNELRENSNGYILDKLIVLNEHPQSFMNRNIFLHDIDAMGQSIISLKPTKIISDDISLNLNTTNHALWIDFNMREQSILLVAVSPTDNADTVFAISMRPKLTERLSTEHELKIRGSWSILFGADNVFSKRITMNVYLPIHDRNAFWKAKVKSIFRFVTDDIGNISSQETMATDQRLVQYALNGLGDRRQGIPRTDKSFTSFSLSGSQFQQNSVAPIARTQLDADNISLLGAQRANIENFIANVKDSSETERERLEPDVPLPTEQTIFVDPMCDQLNYSNHLLNDPLIDPLHDSRDNPLEDPLDYQFSDESSGISFGNDVSVMDDVRSENGVDDHTSGIGGHRKSDIDDEQANHIDDQWNDENLETSGSSFRSNFSSANSSLSEINKQVKKFIEGTQNRSGQQMPQPRQQHIDGNVTIAATGSVRDVRGFVSDASIDKPINDEPAKSSSFERRYSSVRASSNLPLTGTEPTKSVGAVDSQNGSPTTFDLLKVHPSNEMAPNEDMNDKICDPHEPRGDDFAITDHDEDNDMCRLVSNMDLMSNESSSELQYDGDGMVFDRHGCVFVSNDEIEDAWYVYIENNGLEYLKSERFKAADSERRRRTEREFRAIHKLIGQRFEDDTFPSNGSMTGAMSGAVKRRSFHSLDDGDDFLHPTKKHKNSETSSLDNAPSDGVAAADTPNSDDRKLQGDSPALTHPNALVDYLKNFFETRELCEGHRGKLLHLITEMQAKNILALSGKEPPATTIANMREMCKQAREYASMIVNGTYKQ